MAQHQTPARHTGDDQLTAWLGWVMFAGLVMVIGGLFNVIEGLIALFNDDYYAVRPSGLVVSASYPAWGWTLIGFGVVLGAAGYGVLAGRTWARVVGVVVAAANAVVNLAFIAAYPLWIALTIAVDIVVIYALVVHGREARLLTSRG